MVPDFRRALTLFSLLCATPFLGACGQMQIPEDPLNPRRPLLERLVYEFGTYVGKATFEEKIRSAVASLAQDKGTSAVVSALTLPDEYRAILEREASLDPDEALA